MIDWSVPAMHARRDRRAQFRSLEEEAAEQAHSLRAFMRGAWHVVEPSVPLNWNWHIDAIADALEAVTRGEIRRLQIWVPPGSMKSRAVSIFWPAWEWILRPGLRYFTGSYDIALSGRLTSKCRDLIVSPWYQERWADRFHMKKLDERYYSNDQGGNRLATAPGSTGSGEHGNRILIDDPVNALQADAAAMAAANEWYDATLSTRSADPMSHAEVIIMQRLSEGDLAGHVQQYEQWEILCLPERYEKQHPHAWPRDPRDPDNPPADGIVQGDGALLWPTRVDENENAKRAAKLGAHRAAGQLQQRPAAREGEILKRAHWRYYPAGHLARAEDGDTSALPAFQMIVHSWDTAFKEKTTSDFVVGSTWGVIRGERYLLALRRDRMSLGATKQAMKDTRAWALTRWPQSAHYLVIEKAANGVDIIDQLKREIPGVVAYTAAVDKTTRAEAAAPDLESGNILVPGAQAAALDGYDSALTPAFVQVMIEECAKFPNDLHDDQVDSFTMAVNWIRARQVEPARGSSPHLARIPPVAGTGARR